MKHDYTVACDAEFDLTDEQHEQMKAKLPEFRQLIAKAMKTAYDAILDREPQKIEPCVGCGGKCKCIPFDNRWAVACESEECCYYESPNLATGPLAIACHNAAMKAMRDVMKGER